MPSPQGGPRGARSRRQMPVSLLTTGPACSILCRQARCVVWRRLCQSLSRRVYKREPRPLCDSHSHTRGTRDQTRRQRSIICTAGGGGVDGGGIDGDGIDGGGIDGGGIDGGGIDGGGVDGGGMGVVAAAGGGVLGGGMGIAAAAACVGRPGVGMRIVVTAGGRGGSNATSKRGSAAYWLCPPDPPG